MLRRQLRNRLSVFRANLGPVLLAVSVAVSTTGFAPISIDRTALNLSLPLFSGSWRYFDLNVEIFSGTVWTETQVSQRVEAINRVYAVCKVAIGRLSIKTIAPPTGELNLYRDIAKAGPGGLHDAAVALGKTSTLTLVLIRQFQEGVAGTAGIPSLYAHTLPEMVNRAWVTEETLEPTYLRDRDPSYVPEAHELGHILLNAGHVQDRMNLMADDYRLVNGDLDSSQCASIRSSSLVH
jgi:hypothetical protein